MTVKKCDMCGQEVEDALVTVGNLWRGAELCLECAKPVLEFLNKHELLQKSGLENLYHSAEAV